MKRLFCVLPVTVILVAYAGAGHAIGADDLFFWNVKLSKKTAAPGELLHVTAEVLIAPEHYVYREYTNFEVAADPTIRVGKTIYPEGQPYQDPIEDREIEVYPKYAAFGIPLWIAPETKEGTYSIRVKFEYQGCSDRACYRDKVEVPPFVVTVQGPPVGGGEPPPAFEPAESKELPALEEYGPSGLLEKIRGLMGKSVFLALPLVFFAGILTSFTPCVYPLIPITVSIFGARDTKSRWESFHLSLTYVFGIGVMYSALGVVAASTGAVFGGIMANPIVIALVAAFFIGMGFSMLGAFAFQLPSGLINSASRVRGTGHAAAFGMGLVSGVIASPCTGPVLAFLLAYVATTGNLFLGFWILLTYALGIGVLFILIGTFSGLAKSLPKSGGWMESVKAVFAVVLFGMALYFLRIVVPPLEAILGNSVWYYLGVAVLVGLAIFLGAFKGSLVQVPPGWKRTKRAAGLACASIAVFVFAGSFAVVPEPVVDWKQGDVQLYLLEARAESRPALVDFYADWCAYCVKMDRETFSDPRVEEALKGFLTIKADFTVSGTNQEEILRREYDVHGLPVLLFFDSDGKLLESKRRHGFVGPEELIELVSDIS